MQQYIDLYNKHLDADTASKAIANFDAQNDYKRPLARPRDVFDALAWGFNFHRSNEGVQFWTNITLASI